MTDHTPEPWKISANGFNVEASHEARTVCQTQPSAFMRPDAARIVACVNACAGIPTEQLKAGSVVNALDKLEKMENISHHKRAWELAAAALAPFRED